MKDQGLVLKILGISKWSSPSQQACAERILSEFGMEDLKSLEMRSRKKKKHDVA